MLNKEKYKEEIEKIIDDGSDMALTEDGLKRCKDVSCTKCMFMSSYCGCSCVRNAWLNSQYVENSERMSEYDEIINEVLENIDFFGKDKVFMQTQYHEGMVDAYKNVEKMLRRRKLLKDAYDMVRHDAM